MFHVLSADAEVLISTEHSNGTKVLCDVKTPRCAISKKRFNDLLNNGRLNDDRCCKSCFRKAGGQR